MAIILAIELSIHAHNTAYIDPFIHAYITARIEPSIQAAPSMDP
jgi:hypothetical protein